MNNFKNLFFLMIFSCVLLSCSGDDKECTKATGASGIKQDGVMVYRVTLDSGETLVVNKATAEYYNNSDRRKECYSYKESSK